MTFSIPRSRGFSRLVVALSAVLAGGAVAQPSQRIADISPGVAQIEKRLNDFRSSDLGNGQVLTIRYRDNQSDPIYVRVGRTTTLQFQADETLTDVMYDDPTALEDHIAKDQRKLTVRLKRLATVPGTAITTKRTYFFVLTPTDFPNAWYQGVAFDSTDSRNPFGTSVTAPAGANVTFAEAAPAASPNNDVFTGSPNFNYRVEGEANFKPVAVYDNGRFTWIQMPGNIQTMPAVFEVGANGLEVVNYVPHNNGTSLLVNRLMPKFLLKLGSTEVTITAGAASR
jgi:type IV secretory pathway VirB9-like protein